MTLFMKMELLISYLIQSGQISKGFLPLWVVEQLRIQFDLKSVGLKVLTDEDVMLGLFTPF